MGKRINTAKWIKSRQHWRIDVQKDGQRKSFYSSAPGRKGMRECHKKADEWLDDNIVNSRIRVKELSEMFMKEKFMSISASRQKNIRALFNKWINPRLGNRKISDLSEQDLQNVLNDMFRKGKAKRTINGCKQVLQELMKYARKNNLTKLFPENLTVNRLASDSRTRHSLERNDIKVLFESDMTIMNRVPQPDPWIHAYRFLVLTGLRRGEMLGLKWEDVKEHSIEIKRSINEDREVTDGKTINARRSIPLTRDIRNLLDQLVKKDEWIFWNGCRPYTVTYRFKKYVEYNHLSVRTLHELRHTFITLYDDILPINTVKNIVGHSKSMKTVDVYGHMTSDQMEKAKRIMEEEMGNIIKIG